ncbi:MAG: hypothetical protein HY913_10175 [Desulfomonile tiedjei]|nr:hypothetical protein [Desulfomonile tiedjei]
MSSPDDKVLLREFSCPFSAGIEFEQVLSKAEALLHDADLESALELLTRLETKYVDAAKLFDLLGEVLLRRGNIEQGIRYKTLHEILKGTFKIASAESIAQVRPAAQRPLGARAASEPLAGIAPPCDVHKEASRVRDAEEEARRKRAEFIPVTAAMGREFMRQGHFDKAFEIFSLLLQKNPEDESLIQARERARKKSSEKKLLWVLQRWLENIEQMKAGRSLGE